MAKECQNAKCHKESVWEIDGEHYCHSHRPFFAKEHINTKDGSLDYRKGKNVLNHQLIFSADPLGAPRHVKFFYNEPEEDVVKRFEKEHNSACTWQEIEDDLGNKWSGYVITEKEPA